MLLPLNGLRPSPRAPLMCSSPKRTTRKGTAFARLLCQSPAYLGLWRSLCSIAKLTVIADRGKEVCLPGLSLQALASGSNRTQESVLRGLLVMPQKTDREVEEGGLTKRGKS